MRVALAGVGHWHAAMHARAARAADATLAGIWDESADLSARFAAAEGGTAMDFDALIAGRPDLVVAMGSADRMPARTGRLLDAGLAVVMEKPAALSAAALAPLAARVACEGRFVAVPLPNRLSPIWAEAERLRRAGRLGALSHAQFRLINGPPARYRRDGVGWVLDPARHGGGALRNLGIHGVDAALMLAGGAALDIVGATLGGIHGEAVEDYALVTLRARDGLIVTVEAGYTYPSMAAGGAFEWRLSAANAWLADSGGAAHAATLDDGRDRALAPLPQDARYARMMADTLDRLARGAPPAVSIHDYVNAMALIDRIYAQAR